MQSSFEVLFKYYLKRSGYQQKDVAQWLTVTPSTISRWIHRKRPIPYSELKLICDRLELSIKESAGLFELAGLSEPSQNSQVQNNSLLASPSDTGLRQREEEYLTRLRTRPDFRRWQQLYVPLSGGYYRFERKFHQIVVHGEGLERQIERRELADIRDALVEHKSFILLARPGAGKTAVLQRLTLDLARTRLQDDANLLPLFVRLSHQKPDERPEEFLARCWHYEMPRTTQDDFLEALQQGRLCIFCDALNEARRANYVERADDWRDFAADLPAGNRIVFSCRTLDYNGALAIQQVEIDPLSTTQIQEFAYVYLGEKKGRQLWDKLQSEHSDLLPLAQIPYYLYMLVEEYQLADGLPTQRAQLFDNFASELLGREELKRHPNWIDKQALHYALAQLAYTMQRAGEGTLLERKQALDSLPTSIVLSNQETITTPPSDTLFLGHAATVLSVDTDGSVRFTHHLLQEYFAAQDLLRRYLTGEDLTDLWRVPVLACDMPDVSRGEWDPLPPPPTTGWEQTTILAASLYPPLIDTVGPVNPALATRCLLESGTQVGPEKLAGSRQAMLERLGNVAIHLRSRIEAGLLLGQLGDPRFVVEKSNGVRIILPSMVAIDPTGATIGSDTQDLDADTNECPRHSVTLAPYAIGRYPVTNAEYGCFMAAGGYEKEEYWGTGGKYWLRGEPVPGEKDPIDWWVRTWKRFKENPSEIDEMIKQGIMTEHDADQQWRPLIIQSKKQVIEKVREWYPRGEMVREPRFWHDETFNSPNQPVVGISWYEAVAYANWLATVTTTPYRLPSEAEWEWAARRGRRTFPWGIHWNEAKCNSLEEPVMQTTPVGSYSHGCTPDGIHELSGNVWEWTATRFAGYPYDPVLRLEDSATVGSRVMRGGNWAAQRQHMRSPSRYQHNPTLRYHEHRMSPRQIIY